MSKRSPKSVEEKLEVVNLYLTHHQPTSSLVKQFGITNTTLREWVRRYEQDGVDGLKESRTWNNYSSDLKEQAIRDYLEGRASQRQIV